MRIAILVTHLLGTGHLKRASLLADGFARAGHEAVVISGGFPAPNANPSNARLVQLPPLRTDSSFTTLFSKKGEADSAVFDARNGQIKAAITSLAPDMLITELFPFGRRKLAAEFEAAIASAGDALVYASIRDILQRPRKPGRVEEAEDRFDRLYHGAFVHGDEALVPLSDSWHLPQALMARAAYTGYVTDPEVALERSDVGEGEVIVSAGGGSVGDDLFEAAAKAGDERWRLLVGGHDRDARIAQLQSSGTAAMVEAVRPDFQTLLTNADLAVLQCGYNSAMDVIRSGVRAIFVPFEGDGETEQITRARAMTERYGCGLLREGDVSADALATEARRILAGPKPDFRGVRLDGVERTVALAEAAVEGR